VDPYKTRQDVTEKILLEVSEAQSHNSDICDSKTETLQLLREVEEDGVGGALFVQQLRTEKRTGNVASAQNGCARGIMSRQFKYHATVTRKNLSIHKFL
jgi:hypothetical protein